MGPSSNPGSPIPPAEEKSKEDGLGLPGMVLAAIGGSIGVLTFVAFFGGAILWVRMDEAGLPGGEAVALVPRSVLLATGAKFLVPSLLAALGFTALLYVVEAWTREHSQRSLKRLEEDLDKKEGEAEARHKEALEACEKAEEMTEKADSARKATEELAQTPGFDREIVNKAREESENIAANAQNLQGETIPAAQRAQEELIQARRDVEFERQAACTDFERKRRHLRRTLVVLLFAIGSVTTFLAFSVELGFGRFAVLLVLIVALATFCLSVLDRHRFAWFALATFVAIGILSGFLTYYRTVDRPKVEPAAVLRTDGPPVYGFFVAQTSDRVYVGTTMAGGALRLTAIPREEVTDLVVADLEPLRRALITGRELAIQSCRLARQRSATDSPSTQIATSSAEADVERQVEPCTDEDLIRLTGAAGT